MYHAAGFCRKHAVADKMGSRQFISPIRLLSCLLLIFNGVFSKSQSIESIQQLFHFWYINELSLINGKILTNWTSRQLLLLVVDDHWLTAVRCTHRLIQYTNSRKLIITYTYTLY